ncbi:MAG: hypothetical protein QOI42_2122 [Frankiaceae bacterium]|nr:hypothetical protein [Frankiaceae bacterium]
MSSWLGLLAAVIAFGVASLLQAAGARRTSPGTPFVRAAAEFLRSWQYVAGTVLDVVAVLLSAFALRDLPLFVVQAASSSSLVITALGSRLFFPQERHPWALPSVVALVGGLSLLGSSAAHSRSLAVGSLGTMLLAAGLPVLWLTGQALRRSGAADHVRHAVLSGLAYAGMGISFRVLHVPANPFLTLTQVPALAACGYFVVALFFFGRALRGGTVTEAMAIVVALDTILPAGIGVLLLGDATRPGWLAAAVVGLVVTVAGVVSLIHTMPEDPSPPVTQADEDVLVSR